MNTRLRRVLRTWQRIRRTVRIGRNYAKRPFQGETFDYLVWDEPPDRMWGRTPGVVLINGVEVGIIQ